MKQQSSRTQAITAQLERATTEYLESKDQFENARVDFEAAREKFGGVRRLASEVLPSMDWIRWQEQHRDVCFAGMSIGDAILELLRSRATERAWEVVSNEDGCDEPPPYVPGMSLNMIAEALDAGGFEFRSTTARREVNAALLQLKGVQKVHEGIYQIEEADEILERTRDIQHQCSG